MENYMTYVSVSISIYIIIYALTLTAFCIYLNSVQMHLGLIV